MCCTNRHAAFLNQRKAREAHAEDELICLGKTFSNKQDAGSSAEQGQFCNGIHTYSSPLSRWHGL